MSENDNQQLPLAGLKVLELTHTIMGPSCGIVLGDLGADVIKIEPREGERTRRLAGFAAGFFTMFNRNKRSLCIDLKHPKGKKILCQMVEQADILVENFAPGTMDKLGLGYDDLAPLNPGLIYCSLKGFLSGPYEHRQALDEVVQFMGGLAYMTGPRGRPLRAGASVIDILGGTFGVVGILAALHERQQTGRGQLVKSALYESTVWLMASHMAGQAVTGKPVPPMPERWGAWAIYETFPTKDGEQIFVGITSNNHWQRFCHEFNREDLLTDASLATNEDRIREQHRIKPIVAKIIANLSKPDLITIFDRINIPFAPVSRTEDLFDDPHLNQSGRLTDVQLPNGNHTKLPLLPLEIGQHQLNLRYQPPAAGEHSRQILAEYGMDRQSIDSLLKEQIISTSSQDDC